MTEKKTDRGHDGTRPDAAVLTGIHGKPASVIRTTAEILEAQALRDHLAAEIDDTPGTSEAVNRLVGRYIDAEQNYRDTIAPSG